LGKYERLQEKTVQKKIQNNHRTDILIYGFFFVAATANRTEVKGNQHIGATKTSLGIQTSDFFVVSNIFEVGLLKGRLFWRRSFHLLACSSLKRGLTGAFNAHQVCKSY
jgi:hypothetical protein